MAKGMSPSKRHGVKGENGGKDEASGIKDG